MKNLMLLALAMLSAFFFGCTGSSELRSGDLPLEDVIKAKGVYSDLIAHYQELESGLNDRNNNLIIQSQDTLSEIPRQEILKQIKTNDLLISSYRKKISQMEEELNSFVVRAVGKDKQKTVKVNVHGGSLQDIANIMAVSNYYEGKVAGSSDSAAVMSFSLGQIRADVYLSGRRITSCFLNSAKPIKVINIPGPGYYEVIFTDVNSNEAIKVGRFVDCIARDEIDQGAFAFVATVGQK